MSSISAQTYASSTPVGAARAGAARHAGVDLGRVLGCLSVIFLHQMAADYGGAGAVSDVLDQLARWAVPFFFIASGYYLDPDRPWSLTVRRQGSRLAPIFLFWCLVYLVLDGTLVATLTDPAELMDTLITGGPGYHLWFLASLFLSVAVAALLSEVLPRRGFLPVALVLYGLGLALGSYSALLPEAARISFDARNGIFFGLVYVAIGMALRRGGERLPEGLGPLLLAFGLALSSIEILFLDRLFGIPMARHDFLAGTLFLAGGAALVFLRMEVPPGPVRRLVCETGCASLGIYALHLMVLDALTAWLDPHSATAGIAIALATMAVSTALALAGARVPVLRRVFS